MMNNIAGLEPPMKRHRVRLILSKEFVEKHGGRIWVESEAAKDRIFRFTLPGIILETTERNLTNSESAKVRN
jgi:light-regulated signal transduction histidine kinase (bacteriophytochrome)